MVNFYRNSPFLCTMHKKQTSFLCISFKIPIAKITKWVYYITIPNNKLFSFSLLFYLYKKGRRFERTGIFSLYESFIYTKN